MKLGQKASTLYNSPSEKDPMIYPEVSLPSALFTGSGYKVGSKCVVEFTGVIENMGKDSYRVKLTEGKEVETAAEDKKEESLIKKAK